MAATTVTKEFGVGFPVARKADRNASVLAMARQVPPPPVAVIGQEFGITKERVRQIFARAGVAKPPAQKWTAWCACGKKLAHGNWRCMECRIAATLRVTQPCAFCSAPVTRRASDVRSRMKTTGKDFLLAFCTRQCHGSYMARQCDFGVHPEHRTGHRRPRCYDWDAIWELHQQTGFGARRLSRLAGIPVPALSNILRKMRDGAILTKS